jgi:hypothetical protein
MRAAIAAHEAGADMSTATRAARVARMMGIGRLTKRMRMVASF